MNPSGFRYHPDILEQFLHICGGVILAGGLRNRPSPPELQESFFSEQKRILQRIGDSALSEIPSLGGWRQAFRRFNVDPTKYRSAAEALLRRLTKKGDIPSISALVDVCNLVSIRYALPVAALDTRWVTGAITVKFASGAEKFTAHDSPEPERPEAGEVIFVDEAGLVVARRWCWKQSVESTVTLETVKAILTIEAQHAGGEAEVRKALADLRVLMERYVGGSLKVGMLSRQGSDLLEN